MLGLGVGRVDVAEHLELVELVHADDAAGVLAVAAGLSAVARRPARVAERSLGEVDDLVGVVAGECDLAGAGEVELVVGQVVDVLGVSAEESGALHDLGAHERGRDERREPRGERAVEAHGHERELEAGADALEVVEARTRHLRAARHVDRVDQLADLEVVARLEREGRDLADLAQHEVVVFTAGGHAVDHDVADALHRGGEGGLGVVRPLVRLLHPRGELPAPARRGRPSPLSEPSRPACRTRSARRAAPRTR